MGKKTATPKIEEKTKEELDVIMQVIKDSNLPESVKDFIIKCVEAALWFPYIIQKKNTSLKRLKLMLFGKSYASDFKNKINSAPSASQRGTLLI